MNWNEPRQLDGEAWATVNGFPSAQVSSFGRLRRTNGPIRTLHHDNKGYSRVILTQATVPHTLYLHRLVALAFVPNPGDLPEVDHKDGNPRHNQADNLLWITHQDNIAAAIARKGGHWRKGIPNTAVMTAITRVNPSTGDRVCYPSIKAATMELNTMQGVARGNPLTYRNAAPNICAARRDKGMAYGFKWE